MQPRTIWARTALCMTTATLALIGPLTDSAAAVAGDVTTIAGGGIGFADGTGAAALFNFPTGIEQAADGILYVVDADNDRIRTVTPAGAVTTIAGSTRGYQDGPAATAKFSFPSDIALDPAGNVYVTDSNNRTIRMLSPAGVVSSVLPQFSFSQYPTGLIYLASPSPRLIVAVADHRIYSIDLGTGALTTVAGTGAAGFADNADPLLATFQFPFRLAYVASTDTLYVADFGNHAIRALSSDGVTTYAGTGTSGTTNGPRSLAQFKNPVGLDNDGSGNLYVADYGNHLVRRIDASTGNVCTMAGSGTPGLLDGASATAMLQYPHSIVADDTSGTVWITDNAVLNGIHVVRRVDGVTERCSAAVAPIKVSAQNAPDVVEGNSGTRQMSFRLTLDRAAVGGESVRFTTQAGTATPGTDFTAVDRVVTFGDGDTEATVTVDIIGDTTDEPDEQVPATISDPVGLTLNGSAAAGLILDDDEPASTRCAPGDTVALTWPGITLGRTPSPVSVRSATTATSIPSGTWAVRLTSFDPGHAPGVHTDQTKEQWRLQLKAGNRSVVWSGTTPDLPTNLTSKTYNVGRVTVPDGTTIDSVTAAHLLASKPTNQWGSTHSIQPDRALLTCVG